MASCAAQPIWPELGQSVLAAQLAVSMVFNLGFLKKNTEPLMHALSPHEGPVESIFNFI